MAACVARWSGWALVALAGCSSHDGAAPQTTASPSVLEMRAQMLRSVQHPCPNVARSAEGGDLVDLRQVFTEVFLFEGPAATLRAARVADLAQLAEDPSLQLLAAPHLVSTLEQRTESTLVEHMGVSHEASLYRLGVLPRESSDGSVVLELEVTLQLPNPRGLVPAPTGATTLTTTGGEQQLLLATGPLPHRQDRALLAFAKYWRLRDTRDLRGIFECKMQQRRAELLRRGQR